MRVAAVHLRRLRLPMQEPFETSFGVETDKDVIIVQLETDSGAVGYAECVAMAAPLYSDETTGTAWHVLTEFFIPYLFRVPQLMDFSSVEDLHQIRRHFAHFKGNQMAKAALEMALWDAFAADTGRPLTDLLGGDKGAIPVGISVGIQPSIDALLKKVEGYLEQGFQRIKVKIKPGYDYHPLSALRREFGDIPLMADANSAYTLAAVDTFQRLDSLGLTMIEQPLAHDDLVDHAALQRQLATPICLDESIHHAEDARKAIELGACRIINLKLGRVGGFGEALAIHQLCQAHGIPLWCGGMLETGIGRLHNIAVTALPGFTLPGDTAPSARYFAEDIVDPPVTFARPGFLAVERLAGVGARVRTDRLEKWTVEEAHLTRQGRAE
ncbi:o-succinylbenzoate synthase [Alicyclobacillus shizuokensis]|uniref:o-succinylbenzoate synthase n=1 Tax=Alicyclobacillus shizuokensis TaxID=392014 RepID=UPI00082C211B|nr:o-succinylbenzoate synthase [Alicyclobacillus shizuokensis]MCL6626835.1 o-succinylbenzoate synthase [Alicyclobacillus shizuokensis]